MRTHFYLFALFVCLASCLLTGTKELSAFSYVTAGGSQPADTIVHPAGYDGEGGTLELTLALHSDFEHLEADFSFAAKQATDIWNHLLVASTSLSEPAEISSKGGTDVFGVLIHEMGHDLGLGHPALNPQPDLRVKGKFTIAGKGPNGKFDLDPGPDGLGGNSDDLRGDDVNTNYFKRVDNNPFTLPENGVIDSTTYSRDLADLPEGHRFSTMSDRRIAVSEEFGLEDIEGMMITGGSLRLSGVRRALGADDVAGIRFAMSGVDEIQGTDDDYDIRIRYVGIADEADILVRFDGKSPYAAAGVRTKPLEGRHHVMLPNRIIGYNPKPPSNRYWMVPIPHSVDAEVTPINERAVSIKLRTQVGQRYAITWPGEVYLDNKTSDQIIVQYEGKNLTPMSGSLHMFIADQNETEIKIAFPEGSPGLDDVTVHHIQGKKLEL